MLAALAWGLAVAVALPSLLQPHNGDSAIFDYVARAWLDGEWPYAQALDHKPPGIFLVHVVARATSGGAAWGFRALDLLVVLSMGWPLARLLAPGCRGAQALATLLVSATYYVCASYWLAGQTETWLAAAGLWGCVWIRGPRLAPAFAAGAALGLAFSMKFTAALFALPVLLAAFTGPRGRLFGRLAAATAGGLLALAAVFAPFAATGRWPALWEALVEFNRYYRDAVIAQQVGRRAFWIGLASAFSAAAAAGLAIGLFRRARGGARQPPADLAVWAACGLCALAGVELQQKHLAYHWMVATPFVAGGVLLLCLELARLSPRRVPPLLPALVVIGVAIVLQDPPAFRPTRWRPPPYREQVRDAASLLDGTLSRREYLDRFDFTHASGALAALAESANARSRPGDSLCVTGLFAPMAYAYTPMRCPSRFFSDHVFGYLQAQPELARRFSHWYREHGESLRARPPRFLVAADAGRCWLELRTASAYARVSREGYLALYERAGGADGGCPP
jgi:hypothetical protein